ncbi:MAG: hypothetical protein JSV50_11315 [Desulfobacteraceae bacterium]|nr:MAG: hypothetical protein JSV50_11315 [Desulfobacteraceae bacterium]
MPKITLDLPFEKIVETVKGLSEDEKEQLFFAINEDYAKALGKMKDDAWKEHLAGKNIPLEDLQ